MSMADAATFFGALIATFLISRLVLFLVRKQKRTTIMLLWVHIASYLATSGLYAAAPATSGQWTFALAMYALPQALWFLFDRVRLGRPK